MCGIVGIFAKQQDVRIEEPALRKMCDTIAHRGPDDSGYFVEGGVGLGARRLSIIDIATGHQPIYNEDKTILVVFNGEIYNFIELRKDLISRGHRFSTDSDTEVIVHLYEEKGAECTQELNGIFSFLVFNRRTKEMLAVRDRLGVKPLYYFEDERLFICASEIKAILAFPGLKAAVDPVALYHFFSLNYIPAPTTIVKGIQQLSPGTFLKILPSGTRLCTYWNIPRDTIMPASEQELTQQIRLLIKQAVRRMLHSDVPLGAFLSGGIDSSAIVAYAAKYTTSKLNTFSVGFQEQSFDESRYAQIVTKHFGTHHHTIICTPKDVIANLKSFAWHADNLLADPSMIALYQVSKLARSLITVCLSGDGGDEIFMGYPTYQADCYAQWYQRLPKFIRAMLIEPAVRMLPASTKKLSFEYKAKKFIEGTHFSLPKAHYWWRTIFTDTEKTALLSEDFLKALPQGTDTYTTYLKHFRAEKDKETALADYNYSDMKVWLPDDNLIRVDTMSMAHSLEVRVPLLDQELVEFMARIPAQTRMHRGKLKYLFKKAMSEILPPSIINREKAGLHIPLADWFRKELFDFLRSSLLDSNIMRSGIIKRDTVTHLIEEHRRMRANNAFKLWGLLMCAQWYENFMQPNSTNTSQTT